MDAPTNLEFDVEMTCGKCVQAIQKALNGVQGIQSVSVDLDKGQVLVESSVSSETVKSLIETTGRRAVLKGMGGSKGSSHLGAAVSIMDTGSDVVKGVIRFVQRDQDRLVVDGTIDGLGPGSHALCVHECGDISNGCESCGDVFVSSSNEKQPATGDMGNIQAGTDGRAEFRFINERMKVWELIGRSMMIHSCPSDVAHCSPHGQDGRISCGIIARSAGLFQNSKKICACDGVSQWDERDKPLAGAGRRNNMANL